MGKVKIGLVSLKMGDIAVDGGMGTVLTPFTGTVVDTAVMSEEDGTTNDFPIEESDSPFYSETIPGSQTFVFSVYDTDPASLVRLLGGTATTDLSGRSVYEAPDTKPSIEQSFELIDKKGNITEIVRGKVIGKYDKKFQKSGLAKVDVTVTILQPTKSGVKPWREINALNS
jgi:hypothetical protein